MKLEGAGVLITGGGSGLGKAAATRLARAGAHVVIGDRDESAAKEVAEQIGAVAVEMDVRDDAQVAEAVRRAAQSSDRGLRVVVNCAGVGPFTPLIDDDGPAPMDDFDLTITTNLLGTIRVLRHAASQIASQPPEDGERGVIVNTSSIAAYEGLAGQVAYSASKGGIVALTLAAARDLSAHAIRVNTIAPGLFDTPLMATVPAATADALSAMTPYPKRFGQPEEFAAFVEHLAVNQMFNGEVSRLDGALRMSG